MKKIRFKSIKKATGATLIEILIAICLASLVMLPMILIFGVTEKVTYKSINEVVACNLALQKVEELKSRPFEDLKQIIEQASDDPEEGPFKEVILPLEANGIWNTPGVEYSREPRISFYPYVNPDPTKTDFELQKRRIRIRVIVNFIEKLPGMKDKEKHFELSTILSDETYGSGLNATFTSTIK